MGEKIDKNWSQMPFRQQKMVGVTKDEGEIKHQMEAQEAIVETQSCRGFFGANSGIKTLLQSVDYKS